MLILTIAPTPSLTLALTLALTLPPTLALTLPPPLPHPYPYLFQPNLIPREIETPRLNGVAPVGA